MHFSTQARHLGIVGSKQNLSNLIEAAVGFAR